MHQQDQFVTIALLGVCPHFFFIFLNELILRSKRIMCAFKSEFLFHVSLHICGQQLIFKYKEIRSKCLNVT